MAAATIMKLNVANNDRGERLPRPHTPCPLVQPEPRRVPKPMSTPDTASTGKPCGKLMVPNPSSAAGSARPIKKAILQPFAPKTPLAAFSKMPLIPAILPFSSKSVAAPAP